MITDEALYRRLEAALSAAHGVERAVTIDQLAMQLGFVKSHPTTGAEVPDRRPVEAALTESWERFPFVLVSGSPGIWRPTTADDLNQFLRGLRSRHAALRRKDDTTCHKARAAGWTEENGRFVPPRRAVQTDWITNAVESTREVQS